MPMPIVAFWAVKEYAKTDFGRVKFEIPTDELEKHILMRYEHGAPQEELDRLETLFAGRVTDEDILMWDADPQMSEEMINGASLEECLSDSYFRYVQAQIDPLRHTTDQEFIEGMRSVLWEAGCRCQKLKDGVTDEQIIDAARDIFERRNELVRRYKRKNKYRHIPPRLKTIISLS